MKRTVLPQRDEVASRNQQANASPVQRCVPYDNGQDQLPHTPTHKAPPSYQDMADGSTVVQAAETMQMAADAMANAAHGGPVVQGWFHYTSTRVDAKYLENSEKVEWLEGVMRTGKKARELLKGSTKQKGEKLVRDRVAAIIALARQPNQFIPKKDILGEQDLRDLADAEIRRMEEERLVQSRAAAYREQSKNRSIHDDVEVEEALDTQDIDQLAPDERIKAMTKLLIAKKAFPKENIDELQKQALIGQRGFVTELEIAYQAAIARPGDRIQVGALKGDDPADLLGYQPAEHQDLNKFVHIGSDIVVWSNTEETGRKTQFIQSKDVQSDETLEENAEAAANQLAGLGANGQGLGAGENTYIGANYEGIVFLRLVQIDNIANAKKAAAKAFSTGKSYVSKVILQVDLDEKHPSGAYWVTGFYTFAEGAKLTMEKTHYNPIFGAVDKPSAPKQSEASGDHVGREVKEKDGVLVLPGQHLLDADLEDDAELLTAQEAEESIAVEQSMAQSEPLASMDALAIQDEPDSQPIPKAKANPKPPKGGNKGKPAKKLTKQQKKSLNHPVTIIRKSTQEDDDA